MTSTNIYLEKFKEQEGCITFPPANEASINKTNEFLVNKNFCPLPIEYTNFLESTDGMIFNGIEFFGSIEYYRHEKAYTFPDISTVNNTYNSYKFFTRKVVIGRLSESIILFDGKDSFYSIVDRMRLRSRLEVKTFSELLKYLTRYIPS